MNQILETYYQAKNAHDVSGMAACFAEDATVRDEHNDYRGIAAITDWIQDTTNQYRVSVHVQDVREAGADTLVRALVSGNFDGSPIEMEYRFTLGDGKIRALTIE